MFHQTLDYCSLNYFISVYKPDSVDTFDFQFLFRSVNYDSIDTVPFL